MSVLDSLINPRHRLSRDEIARLLKTSPELVAEFEAAYTALEAQDDASPSENFFRVNAKQAAAARRQTAAAPGPDQLDALCERIVDELLTDPGDRRPALAGPAPGAPAVVGRGELMALAPGRRPQLTGTLASFDLDKPSHPLLLALHRRWQSEPHSPTGRQAYHHFRQGLDILDLDAITYEIIGTNPNSMGHWLPALEAAADETGFFRVPQTTVVKVPLPILQLTRLDYAALTPATLKIVDAWAASAFGLDESKAYFVKTGTFSSKFDFRNAKVTGAAEVRELGQYLLYIHHQALQMASPLNGGPSIYGVSTTNEWVVREFIEDPEDRPTIYHGMPLRTEFRVFIDVDAGEVLGISPYWEAQLMLGRLGDAPDAGQPDQLHDWVNYTRTQPLLDADYARHHGEVSEQVGALLPGLRAHGLSGQWSLDVMLCGGTFWLIDMALAQTSALAECVVAGKLRPTQEQWIPALGRTPDGP